MKYKFLVLLMLLLPSAALAEDKSLLSWSRLTLALGAGQAFVHDEAAPRNYLEVGVYSAYNLTPHLSLAHSTLYEPDSNEFTSRVGVRLRMQAAQ